MIVCDASAVVELLRATPTGCVIASRMADPAQELHAPHLLDVEVAQALRRLEARGVLPTAEADLLPRACDGRLKAAPGHRARVEVVAPIAR